MPTARRDRRAALLLALACLVVYNANGRVIATGDTAPARFVPLTLLHKGSVYLQSVEAAASEGQAKPYWTVHMHHGRLASVYPLVTPILVAPLYVPAVLYLDRHGWDDVDAVERVGAWMEKAAASCLAAASAALMLLLLRRQLPLGRALLLTAAFAFGTETWAVSSQALWQHGTAEMLLLAALLAATAEPTAGRLLVAGLACGLLIENRPPDALLAAPFALWALRWARPARRAWIFYAAAALPPLLAVPYDLFTFHQLGGGYTWLLGKTHAEVFFRHAFLYGMAGQLASPGKGLLAYSPFLLWLALWPWRRRAEDAAPPAVSLPAAPRSAPSAPSAAAPPPVPPLLAATLAAAVVLLVAVYAKVDWRAGYSYGPRYLTDAVPVLVWLLAPVVAGLRRAGLAAFAAAALFAVYVQAVGAFLYPGGASDVLYYQPGQAGWDNVWKPADAAWIVEATGSSR